MKALITGASSGIGLDIAKYLASKKYELILVARSKEKLEEVQQTLPTKSTIIVMDLSSEQKVKELCVLMKNERIDMLINNAGFGDFGEFTQTELSKDIEMIHTNIKAVHILTKFALKNMMRHNSGYILNVASAAGFMKGGPLLSTYYATKSYVLSLTQAIHYELKRKKSRVVVSALCPGPVETNFNRVANVDFSSKPLPSKFVAKYAIDQMIGKERMIIIPGIKMKLAKFFSRFVSDKFILRMTYKFQKKKLTK
ncbi:MAG: SDR family oxidoreductase [Bacilli bacterium]|nr:SDR family oxidoreductase [Bacilli bacterium]